MDNKRGQTQTKIIAGIVTTIILGLLILAGPVGAFLLDLDLLDTSVLRGTNAELTGVANFESMDENLDVYFFVIDLAGPVSISCTFMPDGTKVTSCNGFTIEKIHDPSEGPGFGFGYGYGYGQFTGNYTFKITLDTTFYPLGTYETELLALTNEGIFSFEGADLTIYEKEAVLQRCSVRADEGEMTLLGDLFGRDNDFSYYHPQSGNDLGQGHLVAQYRGERFSYKFQTERIIDNDPNMLIIEVIGKYKIQTGPYTNGVTSIVYIDKLHQRVDVMSNDFQVDNAEIDFFVGCD